LEIPYHGEKIEGPAGEAKVGLKQRISILEKKYEINFVIPRMLASRKFIRKYTVLTSQLSFKY